MSDANNIRHSNSVESPIVGRDQELTMLRQCLERSTAGNGNLVLVAGEAGIGKTALVRALAVEAEKQRVLVLTGGSYDLAPRPPYGPWTELLSRYQPDCDLPGLPEALRPGVVNQDVGSQIDLFEIARDLLVEIASVRPVMIVLEDLHWFDPASLSLLRYLTRFADQHRWLIVATYRHHEIPPGHLLYDLLPSLSRDPNATRFVLRPVGKSVIRCLLASHYRLGEQDLIRLSDYLDQHSDGNFLFFWELLRALEEEGRLRPDSQGGSVGDLDRVVVPQLLHQVLDRRLSRLRSGDRALLEVAAVIGSEIHIDVWQQVTGASDEDLEAAIEDALSSGLLSAGESGASVMFTHSLVREALYQRTSFLRRRRIHRSTAEAVMAGSSLDEDLVAYHLQQAGDDRAADWLARAGERAQRAYALLTAAERYEAAANLLEGDHSRRGDRGWLLYRAARQVRFTDVERGIAFLDDAERIGIAAGDPVLSAFAVADRGYLKGAAGDVRGALRDMGAGNDAVDALPADYFNSDDVRDSVADVALRSPELEMQEQRFLQRLGHFNPRRPVHVIVAASVGHLDFAIQTGEPYHDKLARIENPDHHLLSPYADVCNGLAMAYAYLGQPESAREMFLDAYRSMEKVHHRALLATVLNGWLDLVVLPYQADRFQERKQLEEQALRAAQDAHQVMLTDTPEHVANFRILWIEGRWGEAEEIAQSDPVLFFKGMRKQIDLTLAEIARARNDIGLAWKHVGAVLPQGTATEPYDCELRFLLDAERLAANLALDRRDLDRAREWIDALSHWIEWSGAIRGRAEMALLEARYRQVAGDLAGAREHTELAIESASRPRQPLALIEACRFIGILDREDGDLQVAEHHLQQSLRLAEACAAPFEAALTRLEMADLYASAGRLDDAHPLLQQVRVVCEPLGALPTLERVSVIEGSLRASPSLPTGLTHRELDVLRLVARGLSDPEVGEQLFISRRTVNTHLTSIFRKLNVSSRTAAALVAREHELV